MSNPTRPYSLADLVQLSRDATARYSELVKEKSYRFIDPVMVEAVLWALEQHRERAKDGEMPDAVQ